MQHRQIEDEIHMVLECNHYKNIREELLGVYIDQARDKHSGINNEEIFSYIFDQGETNKIGKFICIANQLREEILRGRV